MSLTSEHIAALWRRMEEIFGRQWTERFPAHERAMEFWMAQLGAKRIRPEELAVGVQALVDGGARFPPSLGEFIRLCRPPQRENAAMYRRNLRALEPPTMPAAERKRRLDELRANAGV